VYNPLVIDEELQRELLEMRAEDVRVRQELLESGRLGEGYVSQMEAVHIRNAARLRELIAVHGWPGEDLAGKDGAEAAWFIVQHAIGEPEFQREMLPCCVHARGPGACRCGTLHTWKIG